jgi:hypothetical protein
MEYIKVVAVLEPLDTNIMIFLAEVIDQVNGYIILIRATSHDV